MEIYVCKDRGLDQYCDGSDDFPFRSIQRALDIIEFRVRAYSDKEFLDNSPEGWAG